MTFKQLHYQNTPLLICNVWDIASTRMAEQLGFQAIGTSSAAIAAQAGYDDGENITFNQLFNTVENICNHTSLPVSVDIEAGYSTNIELMIEHIDVLANKGIVGINIEDSLCNPHRHLRDAENFAATIEAIVAHVNRLKHDIFINVRIDTFVINHSEALAETLRRIQLYEKARADGIFIPAIEQITDIEAVVKQTTLPVNVMCMPNLPNFITLKKLGIKRISMGDFLYQNAQKHLKKQLQNIKTEQSFETVFK